MIHGYFTKFDGQMQKINSYLETKNSFFMMIPVKCHFASFLSILLVMDIT